MKIQLDHIQRLNLHALLGAQRGDLAMIRALWALQDRIALTRDEERAIELKREFAAGQECVMWNPACTISASEFDFGEQDAARIRAAIETWNLYGAAADRRWLEPIVRAFQSPEAEPSRS